MTNNHPPSAPRLGIQGPVLALADPWALEQSDVIMRTGTGAVYPSQDPPAERDAYVAALRELGADFYVHHAFPDLSGQAELLDDLTQSGLDVVLGNEYGNINGPWVPGTNRYDVPDGEVERFASSGRLIGLLYDEPEHLQINAGQYRKDGWFPHWGSSGGGDLQREEDTAVAAITERVRHVEDVLARRGLAGASVPLISEQVFPTMFHAHARAGMAVCPKVMKESFQSLQLSTALGAAKQYGRPLWICADLWGPDIGKWFTRLPGFPGHSPEEFASALRLAYLMGPTHLFAENVDALLQHDGRTLHRTAFGDVWQSFVKSYVPANPLVWAHADVAETIAVIHSDDGDYGQRQRLYGSRGLDSTPETASIFEIWHLLSHGTIPRHGSCMHIPGYDFPRHLLKREVPSDRFPLREGASHLEQTATHPLFYPVNNVVVYDERVTDTQLGQPGLIVVGGSRLSPQTLEVVRNRAENGATVLIAGWLVPESWRENRRLGSGSWIVVDSFLSDLARETAQPYLGREDCWIQRFGKTEIAIYGGNNSGTTLDFEIRPQP